MPTRSWLTRLLAIGLLAIVSGCGLSATDSKPYKYQILKRIDKPGHRTIRVLVLQFGGSNRFGPDPQINAMSLEIVAKEHYKGKLAIEYYMINGNPNSPDKYAYYVTYDENGVIGLTK